MGVNPSTIHDPNRVLAGIHATLARFGEVDARVEELVATESAFREENVNDTKGIDHDKERNPRNALELALDWKSLAELAVTTRPNHAAIVEGDFVEEQDVLLAPVDAVELVGKANNVLFLDVDRPPFE